MLISSEAARTTSSVIHEVEMDHEWKLHTPQVELKTAPYSPLLREWQKKSFQEA